MTDSLSRLIEERRPLLRLNEGPDAKTILNKKQKQEVKFLLSIFPGIHKGLLSQTRPDSYFKRIFASEKQFGGVGSEGGYLVCKSAAEGSIIFLSIHFTSFRAVWMRTSWFFSTRTTASRPRNFIFCPSFIHVHLLKKVT